MKILLRSFNGASYVWMTVKYDNGFFTVNGESVNNCNIISIMNDNRKNYIQCSCCGKIFKKGSDKFKIHKENAIKPETCFDCPSLAIENASVNKRSFAINTDGSAIEKLERSVRLLCSRYGIWSHVDLNSEEALCRCKKRQCANATEMEIVDFFTQYPGAFDDIITVDKLLDKGYHIVLTGRKNTEFEIICEDDYTIGVCINRLGIITRFYIWYECEYYEVFYSKKYNELYEENCDYVPWYVDDMDDNTREAIKKHIRKLYR